MNAFHRGHAITGLEEISLVICMHLVLVASFESNEARAHWEGELSGFKKTLKRWDKGKKGKKNYTKEIVFDALEVFLTDDSQQELIEAHIESKGMDPERIDWPKSLELAKAFSEDVCG